MSGPATLQSRLQQAVALIGSGDLSGAQTLLTALLRASPGQPDVLQLLGVVHRRAGRLDEAISSFRASLQQADRQPHVHNNLGGALVAADRQTEAERHFRRALALNPDYADAKYNLALLLREKRPAEAKLLLDDVVKAQPKNGNAYDALSLVLGQLGHKQSALAAASTAATLSPLSHSAQHNLGQAALAAREFAKAVDAYRAALRLRPESDASWMGLANALRSQDRNDEALEAMERAVAANPSNIDAHRLLNELLWQTGRANRYLASYAAAIATRPTEIPLRIAYAEELLRINQPAEAEKELALAAKSSPGSPQVEDARARAAAHAGDFDRALSHHRLATKGAPDSPQLCGNLTETLLKSGRYAEALDVSSGALERHPFDQTLLAMHATALRILGDERCERLAGFATIAKVLRVDPPEGFADELSFNAALAGELRKLHATKSHPTDQTLRGGTQTFGSLFERNEPLIVQLRQQLEKAIKSYIAGMPDDRSHPFFGRKTKSFAFSGSWSVRLHEGGFHTNHIHPMGWISSAYYVTLPEETSTAAGKPGWFKLGETNLNLGAHEKIHRVVEPKIGHLVLFPSYFWHGTVPFQSQSERLTVAFDVIPQ